MPIYEEPRRGDDPDARTADLPVPSFAVAIPTRNAGALAAPMIAALKAQSVRPLEVLVVDSASTDDAPQLFRAAGFRVHTIPVAEFNHGGTRNLALALLDSRAAAVVFLTQDAIPANPQALERLLRPFADPSVAMTYGRQIPRVEAGPSERHARLFNYGATSLVKRLPAARALGIKAVFSSNSFAAYRREALQAVGGFPDHIIVGEEQVVAAHALLAGWALVYAADAEVIHSHGYTLTEEFQRYFDVGVFHEAFPVVGTEFGGAGSEGFAFIRSELAYLRRTAPHRIPLAPIHWAVKFLGYRLGRHAGLLPRRVRRMLSMQKYFFRSGQARAAVSATFQAAD